LLGGFKKLLGAFKKLLGAFKKLQCSKAGTSGDMTCSYCGTRNGEGEHRCRRCGRRPGDRLTGEFAPPHTNGALAAQLQPVTASTTAGPPPRIQLQAVPRRAQGTAARRPAARRSHAVQRTLFHQGQPSNVIPIVSYAPGLAETPRARVKVETGTQPPVKTEVKAEKRRKPVAEAQAELDFLPPMPAKARTLSTSVDAVIYCELPVATTQHRAVAAALDWSMVLIAYGLFLLVFRLMGGEFLLTKANLMVFGGMFLLMGFTYGLLFAIAGSETAGMRWTQLRLTTFDGFPPENRTRIVRFAAACLSRCTLLGLLWSLADEECLAWQDHISRTFATPRRLESEILRRR
jgi:uncharacterized RDD family membrane protein YckC